MSDRRLWIGGPLVLLLAGCPGADPDPDRPDPTTKELTLLVTAPANTPTEDTVYVALGPSRVEAMTRTGRDTWERTFTKDEVSDLLNRGKLDYAYTHGHGYVGGEFFADDPTEEEWWGGRRVKWEAGRLVVDQVERWRFFPPDDSPLPDYPVAPGTWEARTGGVAFQRGVQVADYWWSALSPLIAPTDLAASRAGASWIQVAPSWDYGTLDPLPTIVNDPVGLPQYTDHALRSHLDQLATDSFQVMLRVQVCCTSPGDTTTRDSAWWDEWFAQYEAFLVHHAAIAEQEDVDSLLLDWAGHIALPGVPGAPADAATRWHDLLEAVRAEFTGPVGFDLLVAGTPEEYPFVWPWDGVAPIAGELDFLGMSVWMGLSSDPNATQEDLSAKVDERFALTLDAVHTESGLPLVLSSIAYGSYDGAAASALDVYEVALVGHFPESENSLVYDGVEQAMLYHALLEGVASRPHVVGSYPFNFGWIAQPAAPDYSLRGKAAEGVLRAWYQHVEAAEDE